MDPRDDASRIGSSKARLIDTDTVDADIIRTLHGKIDSLGLHVRPDDAFPARTVPSIPLEVRNHNKLFLITAKLAESAIGESERFVVASAKKRWFQCIDDRF